MRQSVALEMNDARDLMLMPPTIKNLRWLAGFDAADDAVVAGEAVTDPPVILPKVRLDADGNLVGVVMPGEPEYDAL